VLYTFNSNRSPILNSGQLQKYFKKYLNDCKNEIIICSAFIKTTGIKWFYKNLSNKKIKCRVISRWNKEDLLSNVSDIEVYEFCKELGWSFEIIENLHAKFYLIDKKNLICGSLNLTAKGLGLLPISNKEFGFFLKAEDEDISNIQTLLNDSIKINDELFAEYKKFLAKHKNFKFPKYPEFPDKIKKLKEKKLKKIWVNDFMFSKFEDLLDDKKNSKDKNHDKFLLNLSGEATDIKNLRIKFRELDIFKWFIKNIKLQKNKTFFFGELSSLIHNSLFDDPKPYRKSIKILQSNFLDYLYKLKIKEIKIERPEHSQKISYLG